MTTGIIRDAVTGVLLHDGELLLTRRQPHLAAFSGYDAFPGGKIDRDDADTPFGVAVLDAHPRRHMHALVRELREEIGFDLAAAAHAGDVTAVQLMGEATTPAFVPQRFRTWFYRVDLVTRPTLTLEHNEVAAEAWATPAEFSARWRRAELLCVPPTRAVIERLAADPDAVHVADLGLVYDPAHELPWVEPLAGLRMILVRSNTIPPAMHTNCFWFGGNGHARVLADPAPADDAEYTRLVRCAQQFGVDLIFLTHHHPDHRERANRLARELGVPMAMSADTHARISRVAGTDWFDGIAVRELADGDVLTHWLDQPVRVVAVPGHDAGHLAPMPDSRAWCIVGDLIQGLGTVVVGGDEGDMALYFRSLEKIIALNPRVIVPSHGAALGTTYRLQVTLVHRKLRERQVLSGWQAGKSVDAMVEELYADVPKPLWPLARVNVESHLAKLRREGRIEA